ncbi:MAG: hypothetical protein V1754_04540 [Pseudomonadota bacterium]
MKRNACMDFRWVCLGSVAIALGTSGVCCGDDTPVQGTSIEISVKTQESVVEVSDRYLSFTIDTYMVVGRNYDLDKPRLVKLASALEPALWRIGGTEADRVYYDLSETPIKEAPDPYKTVMNRTIWDRACNFAKDLGVEIMFNLNAGPGPRVDSNWTPDNARELIAYTKEKNCPVVIWELGNEPGAFVLEHNLFMDGEQLAKDYAVLSDLLDNEDPSSRIAGPSSAFWPIAGEVLAEVTPDFVEHGGDLIDILTWHYYPQQSKNCPVNTRKAAVDTLLDPDNLDEIVTWASHMENLHQTHATHAELWLGETSHAQCGGEPDVSDRFVTGFWWLDQLGLIARRGQQLMLRQDLVGGNYALVDENTLEPNPDFFNSVLWKRLMGTKVLDAQAKDKPDTLRVYSHCTQGRKGAITVLAINLHKEESIILEFVSALDRQKEVYLMTGDSLTAENVRLNGKELFAESDGTVPAFVPEKTTQSVVLPPLSYAMVVLPEADAPACR